VDLAVREFQQEVSHWTYLGSVITIPGTLEAPIDERLAKA